MSAKKFVPITAKDFYLLDALCHERFGEHVEVAWVSVSGSHNKDTNPRCSNCGRGYNGHFEVTETYCPDCGGLIKSKPTPIVKVDE